MAEHDRAYEEETLSQSDFEEAFNKEYEEVYNEWEAYNDYEIVAYAPYPKPYKTRNRNGKSNNRKTNKKTK